METFSLQDLLFLLGMCVLIGLVSAIGPAVWRALPRLWNYFVDRPIGEIAALFMSSGASVPTRPVIGSDSGFEWFEDAVPGQQNQVNQTEPDEQEPAIQFSSLQNLDDENLTALLAVLRLPSGEYRFSANKIRDIVGGSDKVVKAWVAAHRPKEPQPKAPRSIKRPPQGWAA